MSFYKAGLSLQIYDVIFMRSNETQTDSHQQTSGEDSLYIKNITLYTNNPAF